MKAIVRILVILLLATAPAGLAAQGTTDILAGKVLGPDGKPLVGAQVSASSAELGTTRTAVTDSKGRYMIVYPDGGGLYQLKVAFLGMADRTSVVRREADEEVLLTDFGMTVQAIELDAITVQGRRSPTGNGNTAERAQELPQDLLNRLPLADMDATTLALLAAGVIQSANDSINGIGGFSVAGMRDALNQITLDGLAIGSMLTGGAGLEVPQEGLRRTQVVTSTFDASRGGFAGGQVSMTTARGNNRNTGSFTYQLQDASLNGNGGRSALGNASTTHRLSGGFGGPLVRSKLFYQVSFTLQRRINDNFALASGDALADQRTGANPDSVSRFIDILGSAYGFDTEGLTGPYASRNSSLALQTRMDYNITPRHTLMLRYNNNLAGVDSTRISPLDVRDNGGDQESNRHDGAISLTSRLGGAWTNELQLNASRSDQVTSPYLILPEGRIRVTSDLSDGARSVSTLVFGGDRSIPSENWERSVRLRDEVGFLFDLTHRVKVGAEYNRSQFSTYATDNFYGTYTFNSLDDFENNVPASFSRSLSPRERKGGGTTASLWLTDTWRPSNPLQITLGARLDRSGFDERPDYNPAVDATFGRRTDFFPTDLHLSPRIGFSYRLNGQGQPTKVIRGGIGEFRGNAPFNLFSAALQQTGLPGSELTLNCIGGVVPIPDWTRYLNDPASIPQTCVDGGTGAPAAQSTRAPTVTLFNPGFGAPSSWRANIGYQAQVSRFQINLDYTYSLGVGLYGVRDINLDESRFYTLPFEGRPFFGDPSAIVATTGQVSSSTSRVDPLFAGVYEYDSGLRSTSHQVTARLNGMLSNRLSFQGSYTLGFARDQSSFSGGNGGAGFSAATTSGNPNVLEWGTSSNDRRHAFSLILAYPIKPWVQMTLVGRLTSGSPFTPVVSGDVNGDGSSRNDRAFIFDPAAGGDTALTNGMNRLLAAAPGGVVNCLESQFGSIADRNICRNSWTESLDARFMLTPSLPRLGRRLEISADLTNVPAAFDQLFHGKSNLHGWGQQSRADGTLLYARGYDTNGNAFKYEVNELFGQSRAQRFGAGAPFQVRLQARISLGAQQNLGGALGALAFGGGGRGGDGGGRGGFGGGGRGAGGGGFGDFGGRGIAATADGEAAGDSTAPRPNPATGMINRLLPNPARSILVLKDSLGLSVEQAAQLQTIADSLNARLQPLVEEMGKAITAADSANRANQAASGDLQNNGRAGGARGTGGGRGGFGGGPGGRGGLGEAIQKLQPKIDKARNEISSSLKQAEKVLTKDQWKKVPQNIRNSGQGPGGFGRGG